jgi:predicted hydrocarbon binding protein
VKLKHIHKWIDALVKNLDTNLDEKTKVLVLENCGRVCITESMKKRAKKAKQEAKSTAEFLKNLSKVWSHLKLQDKEVYVEYPRCYCPIVASYKGALPKSWCNCSRGWIKELFESTLGKSVKVKLEKSIKQGYNVCRFKVNS